jgi:hypothetical protein
MRGAHLQGSSAETASLLRTAIGSCRPIWRRLLLLLLLPGGSDGGQVDRHNHLARLLLPPPQLVWPAAAARVGLRRFCMTIHIGVRRSRSPTIAALQPPGNLRVTVCVLRLIAHVSNCGMMKALQQG